MHRPVLGDRVDVPVEVVVPDKLGDRLLVGQDRVDQRHRLVPLCGEELADSGPDAQHCLEVGLGPRPRTRVAPLVEEGQQGVDVAQGVGVDQRNCGTERFGGVRSENHIDTLHDHKLMS